MENTNTGPRIEIDPFAAEQEKQKWIKRAEFAVVIFLRGIVYILTLLLKIVVEVLKNVLRTFKIIPN